MGHPHAPAPSILYPVSNIDWHFISYMIVYMFQCHSLKSSHPLPLPQSPKVRSIHLCLLCCLAYRVIITIFLNSIYVCQYTILVFFFLAYFTLYNRLQLHGDDPERWYGVGGEREIQDWGLVYTRGRFMSMYGKTNTVL